MARKRQTERAQEPPALSTTCRICGASHEPPERKMFGNKRPELLNCGRCGKVVCDVCTSSPPEGHYEYGLICSHCYDVLVKEDEKEREEFRRDALEEEDVLEE